MLSRALWVIDAVTALCVCCDPGEAVHLSYGSCGTGALLMYTIAPRAAAAAASTVRDPAFAYPPKILWLYGSLCCSTRNALLRSVLLRALAAASAC
jgi:hypothetical protein